MNFRFFHTFKSTGATILCGWIKVLPLFLIVIPGMISRVLYPDEIGCVDPEICQSICQNPVSCSNIAYPRLVLGIMPEGLRGIMISVMLAALMSDLTSIFNSASTLFTMDVYRKFRESAKPRELLFVGRVCIVILVGISIGWIPLIQQMQGGQLYIYIQSIAAYLSPPIAMIFCLAISWPRMNECGAFWGLMLGLVVGIIRMVLDFSYPAPLCMEEDTRPAIVGEFHYMYFAALLFWLTGITSIIISLITPPDDQYRSIRTTFFTRKSKDIRPDDRKGAEEIPEDFELEALNKDSNTPIVKNMDLNDPCAGDDKTDEVSTRILARQTFLARIRTIIWNVKTGEKDEEKEQQRKLQEEMNNHLDNIAHLEQTTTEKGVLYTNLVLILIGAIVLYVYFSINPFTQEEIEHLRRNANFTIIKP